MNFPYYGKNVLSYNKQQIFNYLKKIADIQLSNDEHNYWCIIAGSDKDLPLTEHEIEQAKKIIGISQKYSLGCSQYKNNPHLHDFILKQKPR